MCEAQTHMVFTERTLKTGITSVITKQCIVFIFKFSCRSSDFLGSSAIEYFEGEGLRDGGNLVGLWPAHHEFQVGHMSSRSARRECGSSAEAWQNQVGSRRPQCVGSVSPAREGIFQRCMDKFYLGLSVHPALPSPVGAQEEIALPFGVTKKHKHRHDMRAQDHARSTLQTLTHNLGKSEDPGEADPA